MATQPRVLRRRSRRERDAPIHAPRRQAGRRGLPSRYSWSRNARGDRGDHARIPTYDRGMAQTMSTNNGDSPAVRVMKEAIELAIEERSPYPERAVFINADGPRTGAAIGRAVV